MTFDLAGATSSQGWRPPEGDLYVGVPLPDEVVPVDEPVGARAWPKPAATVYQGEAGRIIRAVAPHTEADPVAVLASYLAAIGAVVGRDPYMLAANDQHPARIHPLIVGRTSSGAKGTGWSVVRTVILNAFPEFTANIKTGLSSGEGLIEHVRDGNGLHPDDRGFDEGVPDKRLLIIEEEYAAVLNRMRREGSSLGPILRQAWDGGVLSTLTRAATKLAATGAHIVVIGQITPGELSAKLAESDLAGGSFNRLLPILSRRSRLLPDGGNLPDDVLADASATVRATIGKYRSHPAGRLNWTPEAHRLWREVYAWLSADRPDGRLTSATARGKAQVLRLALCYAVCDRATAVDEHHLAAAVALWEYSLGSAKWLFGTADTDKADGLLEFVKAGGEDGRTRTAISTGYFKGHAKREEIDQLLATLIESGLVSETPDSSGRGRPTLRYHYCDLAKIAKLRTKPADQGKHP